MSDNEELLISVDASQAQAGVGQFLSALEQMQAGFQSIFERMSDRPIGRSDIFQQHGQRISEEMLKGSQRALAGFPEYQGTNFSRTVLANAGISPAQTREYRQAVSEINALRSEMLKARDPIATQPMDRRLLMGLPTTASVRETARAMREYERAADQAQKRLSRLQGLTSDPTGALDKQTQWLRGSAKEGFSWTRDAERFAKQAGFTLPAAEKYTTPAGNASEAQARNFMQSEYSQLLMTSRRAAEESARMVEVLRAAPLLKPDTREVQQAITPKQRAVVDAYVANPSATQREIAQIAGVAPSTVHAVSTKYAELIAALQAETQAHRSVAEVTERTGVAAARDRAAASRAAKIRGEDYSIQGRDSFDFRPQPYAPRRDEEGNLERITPYGPDGRRTIPAGFDQGSLYVTDRPQYVRDWEEWSRSGALRHDDAAAAAEIKLSQERLAAIKANGEEWRRLADSGAGLSQMGPSTQFRYERDPQTGELRAVGQPRPVTQRMQSAPLPRTQEGYEQLFGTQSLWARTREQFREGFTGGESKPFAEMVGQTARIATFYGVAYRALTMVQDAISQIVTATIQYEQALTDLSIATNRSTSENKGLANSLTAIAAGAGFTPQQGVEVGWRSLGLFDVAQAPQEEQERVATLSASVATRVARVSGADPVAVQTQLAGAIRSFEYGVERLPQLEDMITYISRNTGQSATELLGATANIAPLGRSAGFTPEQLMALAAQVGTTTGQNPEATAGQFRQVLSREFDVVAERARSVFGMDTSGISDVAGLFDAVSKIDATQDQINAFTAGFGKGGSQSVAMITLENWDRIQELATGATSSPGIGEEAFDRSMSNVGNRLKELGGVFLDFGTSLAESGVADWLVLVVDGARQLVEVGNGLLDLLNEIPRPVRSVAFAVGELYLASKAMAALGMGGRFAGFAAGLQALLGTQLGGRAAAAAAAGTGAAAAAGARTAAALAAPVTRATVMNALRAAPGMFYVRTADRGAIGQADAGPLRAGANRFTAATGITMGGVAVAALAAAAISEVFQREQRGQELVAEVGAQASSARTASELRDVAAAASNARAELEKLSTPEMGDIVGLVPSLISRWTLGDEKAELTRTSEVTEERAAQLEALRERSEAARASTVFQDFSLEGMRATLQGLDERGFSAAERLALLNDALFRFSRMADESTDAVAAMSVADRGLFAASVGMVGPNVINQAREYAQSSADATAVATLNPFTAWSRATGPESEWRARADLLTLNADQRSGLIEALEGEIALGLRRWGADMVITDAEASEIVTSAQQSVQGFFGDDWDSLGEDVQEFITVFLGSQIRGVLDAFSGQVTAENVAAALQLLPEVASARGAEVAAQYDSPTRGNEATLAVLRKGRQDILAVAAKREDGPGLTPEESRFLRLTDQAIAEAERAIVQQRIDNIRSIADFQQSLLPQEDILGRLAIESEALRRQAIEAQKLPGAGGYDPNLGTWVAPTSEWLNASRTRMTAGANNARAEAAERLAITQNRATANVWAADAIGLNRVAVSNLELSLAQMKEFGLEDSSAFGNLMIQLGQARLSLSQSVVQAANANRLANVDPRNDLARIQAQIANARAEMSLLPANQRGALRDQVNQLNQQYQEALVNQANALDTANIAGNRSGLEQARVAIANAQRTLGIQLPGTAAYYNALASLRQAQADLADQERAQLDRVARLGSDITDPVEQARLDVERARRQLEADRASGQGADVITQSELDLKSAEASEEAAAFNQRIRDLQVAEDLGRISHSQYMSYLQSEHDRLSAIADRTRQQQEQLDQVDQLMKAAAEQMQGQFNIGEIALPTIYEVRRAIGAGSPTSVADYSHSNNIINVNGADLATVLEYLETYFGASAQSVTALSGRRI